MSNLQSTIETAFDARADINHENATADQPRPHEP